MVDWAAATGQSIIQILPINDTTMFGTWEDSYPYNANSTFALHPQFLHLPHVGELKDKETMAQYEALGKELNSLPNVDYERVNNAKNEYLRLVFAQDGKKTLASKEFKAFLAANEEWLRPYAVFSALRDAKHTPDFSKWGAMAKYTKAKAAKYEKENPEAVAFHYFVQYHLSKQLREVRDYAHSKGVVLKGDIPIGISRTSADITVNSRDVDLPAFVRSQTDGVGADAVIDITGNPHAIRAGLKAVRKGGIFVSVGLPDGEVGINLTEDIIYREVIYTGVSGRLMFETWEDSMNILQSPGFSLKPVVGGIYPFRDFEKALDALKQGVPGKMILVP